MAAKPSHRTQVTLRHRFEYVGWRLVTTILKIIPRRGMIVFADGAGWMLYNVLRVRRDVIDEQLHMAFKHDKSPAELKAIGQQCWQNAVLTFFEFIQPNSIGSGRLDEFYEQEGSDEYFRPLIDAGTAPLVLTAHIGNWEALGVLARREGLPVAAVAKAMHNPLVNKLILESRARTGVEIIQVKSSMKGIVDAARKGKWVGILGDQDARRRGIFVTFFGRPASTAPGIAHLAHLLDKPLLPSFCVRAPNANRTLKVIFSAPIYPDKSVDREADIYRMTQEHTAALEAVIRRHPAEYFWLHRRWKTQPRKTDVYLPR